MSISDTDYAIYLENTEQVITARNQEEYLVIYPGSFPAPSPTYAAWLPVARAQFEALLAVRAVHSAVLVTGSSGPTLGKVTLTYPTMTTPVVVASVIDATQDNIYFQAALESVSSTAAVLRVTQTSGTTLLGIPLLTVPTLAPGATVHVMAYDAG